MQEIQVEQEKNRDFICPCSKAYFSYAALFTHIKQKHEGKVGTILYSRQDKLSNLNPKTKEEGLEKKWQGKLTVQIIKEMALIQRKNKGFH